MVNERGVLTSTLGSWAGLMEHRSSAPCLLLLLTLTCAVPACGALSVASEQGARAAPGSRLPSPCDNPDLLLFLGRHRLGASCKVLSQGQGHESQRSRPELDLDPPGLGEPDGSSGYLARAYGADSDWPLAPGDKRSEYGTSAKAEGAGAMRKEDYEKASSSRGDGKYGGEAKRWPGAAGGDSQRPGWWSGFRRALLDVRKRRLNSLSINSALVSLAEMLRRSEYYRELERHREELLRMGR